METSPVKGMKISSVVPASMSGNNKPIHLKAMDLVMKLHYIRAIYFFKETCGLISAAELKTNMFALLQSYYHVSGRIRIPENDPNIPYIRCNDSGIRIVEANVDEFTVKEWLDLDDRSIDHRFLVYDHVLGPDLNYSPLVFLQITQFKCGGFSIGLSWAHVLGDIFSASNFMKTMGQLISGHAPPKLIYPQNQKLITHSHNQQVDREAMSIKKIESVGEYWLLTNKCKMGRYIFNLSLNQIDHLMAKYTKPNQTFSEVDILCALIWKSLLNIHSKLDSNVITICDRKISSTCSNDDLVISVVEVKEEMVDISELAASIHSEKKKENDVINKMIDHDKGFSDFFIYGANLTFVNLEMLNMCEFEIKGVKPDFVNYTIHGVGDKGVVLVFPKGKFERSISVVMPQEDLEKLKEEVNNMIM